MKIKYILCLLCFIVPFINSQDLNTLKGHVYDEINNQKIFGAHIIIKELKLYAVTDTNGNYIITDIPDGKYKVTFEYIGYPLQTDTIVFSGIPQNYEFNKALRRYSKPIPKDPRIEEYQTRLKKLAKKDILLKIHIDNIKYADGKIIVFSTFANLSKDTIFIIKECPCFRVIKGIVYKDSNLIQSNVISLDCDVMPYSLIDKSDLIKIDPKDSIKYPPTTLNYYSFESLPDGEYKIGIKYKFGGPLSLGGIYTPPKDEAILLALRGEYSSNNFLIFKK